MVERAVAAVVVATTMHAAVVDGASADAYADYLNSMSEEGTAVVTLSGEVGRGAGVEGSRGGESDRYGETEDG